MTYKIKLFLPSINKLLPTEWNEDLSLYFKAKLLFRQVCGGYKMFYCVIQDNIVGYLLLKKSYLGKYSFMSSKDWIINPYFTHSDYRRMGIATALLNEVKKEKTTIYAFVEVGNKPSINALYGAGFDAVGYAKKGLWRIVPTNEESHLILFKYNG